MPYMELFVLKLDQHAPCFSISEKAYALAYISDAMLLIFEVYIKKLHTKNRTNLTTTQSSKYKKHRSDKIRTLFHRDTVPFTLASSGVIVAHLIPTLYFLMASAASIVTWSRVSSRYGRPRS